MSIRERQKELIRLEHLIREVIALSSVDIQSSKTIRFTESRFSNLYRLRMLLERMDLIQKQRNKETSYQYRHYIPIALERILYDALSEKEEFRKFIKQESDND